MVSALKNGILVHPLIIISVLAILFTCGCTSAITAMVYYTSEIKKTYPGCLEETMAASVRALDQLNIHIVENYRGLVSAKIKGDRPDGVPVTLIFMLKAEKITQLGIRSGFIGAINVEDSEDLHTHIKEQFSIQRPSIWYSSRKRKGLSEATATPH